VRELRSKGQLLGCTAPPLPGHSHCVCACVHLPVASERMLATCVLKKKIILNIIRSHAAHIILEVHLLSFIRCIT
jgi:hypothetical protein